MHQVTGHCDVFAAMVVLLLTQHHNHGAAEELQ
jgi:hypothetical protein